MRKSSMARPRSIWSLLTNALMVWSLPLQTVQDRWLRLSSRRSSLQIPRSWRINFLFDVRRHMCISRWSADDARMQQCIPYSWSRQYSEELLFRPKPIPSLTMAGTLCLLCRCTAQCHLRRGLALRHIPVSPSLVIRDQCLSFTTSRISSPGTPTNTLVKPSSPTSFAQRLRTS